MISRYSFATVSLFLTACAPVPIVDRSAVVDQVGNEPHLGQPAEASPGGLMFTQYSYWHRSAARITAANRQPFGLGGLYVSQGEIVFPSSLGGATVYCSDKRLYSDPIAGFVSKACFTDRDGDGSFDTVQVAPEEEAWIDRPLSPALPYRKMEVPVGNRSAFRYELAYAGYGGQTLQLSYREFRGEELDRPVYTEQVRYDVRNFPATLRFRSVKIQVLKADNDGIRYKILSGF